MVAAKSLGHQIFSFEREMPESPVKSRMVEIQKQIYSEGLGAYEGRAANALKTLSNSALSTGSPFSRTSEGLRGSGSGPQAVAERQSGETVTGTEFQSKNMVPGGKDLKSNFIRTIRAALPGNPAIERWGPVPPLVSARWECLFAKREKATGYGCPQKRFKGSVIDLEGPKS